MELDHLALAEKAVAQGQQHIDREEQMIADLDRGGHDTRLARETLATLRRMQAEHVAHRNLILEMLRQKAQAGPIFRPGQYDSNTPQQEPASPADPKARVS